MTKAVVDTEGVDWSTRTMTPKKWWIFWACLHLDELAKQGPYAHRLTPRRARIMGHMRKAHTRHFGRADRLAAAGAR